MVPTMPSTVSGFTKHDAASAGVVPSCSTRHWSAWLSLNCEYIAPRQVATVLPRSAWAASLSPAATTTPAPSLPQGMGRFMRAAIRADASGGSLSRTADPSASACAPVGSAPPSRRPRSEGLMGAASTRMTTSSAPGSGCGTSTTASSR